MSAMLAERPAATPVMPGPCPVIETQSLRSVERGPAQQRVEGHVTLVARDGFHFFEDAQLPVGGQAVGADGDAGAGFQKIAVIGQAVFDVEVGVGAGCPKRSGAPGLCRADIGYRGEGVVHEQGAVLREHVGQGVKKGWLAGWLELRQ